LVMLNAVCTPIGLLGSRLLSDDVVGVHGGPCLRR
jgi:hypothetical protein